MISKDFIRQDSSRSVRETGKRKFDQSIALLRSIPEQAQFLLIPRPSPTSSIVLAGSGRSGTTWLSDIISGVPRTQQIFEPLNPVWVPDSRKFMGWGLERRCVRSSYLRASSPYPDWYLFLREVLTGQIRSWGWTDRKRTSYLPIRFLIKDIRFNMMLGFLYNQFQPKIIYIKRHPCAVILSQLRSKWNADIQDLLAQHELLDDHLRPCLAKIGQAETSLDALAIWWAAENLVAERQLSEIPHYLLYYENLVMQPETELQRLLEFLDLQPGNLSMTLHEDSRTSRGEIYASDSDRLTRWRDKLSEEEQERIMGWVHLFGLNDYDLTPFPIHSSHDLDDQ